ncbi:MAG: S9 family peptidase [Phycisphaerales bacterium]
MGRFVRTIPTRWPVGRAALARVVGVLVVMVGLTLSRAQAFDDVPLIPRDVLFANPDRAQVRLSPDGRWISYLAAFDGVLNIWIQPADAEAQSAPPGQTIARPLTADRGRGIRRHWWTNSGRHILYMQDDQGDENWRLYSLDVTTGQAIPLTRQGVQARVVDIPPEMAEEVLISINDRDPALHDLYVVNVATGDLRIVAIAPPETTRWITDLRGRMRMIEQATPDGGLQLASPAGGGWQVVASIPPEDMVTTRVLGFGPEPNALYLADSRGRDTAALVRVDLVSGQTETLAARDHVDLGPTLVHPSTGAIQAAGFTEDRLRWTAIDPGVAPDLDFLARVHDGEIIVTSRSLDDQRWLVLYRDDDGPIAFFLYIRGEQPTARFLFNHRDRLESQPLVPMHCVGIEASDGLTLPAYLSLPAGSAPAADRWGNEVPRPREPLPMVLLVHGGPWARDSWGYDPLHQLLANRGYAVLSVNYRASVGFGKAFVNAGDREWGGRIQQDLTDAVGWAIERGIADPQRVAIMGASFGGYAAQAGLAFTPDLYACGVSLVGPSDLTTLLESIPPYWASMRAVFQRRVGDLSTPEGRAFLLDRSPLTHAGAIRRPLLLVHGANDPRVDQGESQRMAATLDAAGVPATLVVFPDEGHGLARPENNLAFVALAEAFLARHLGGRAEPMSDELAESSAQITVGAEHLGRAGGSGTPPGRPPSDQR